MQDYPFLPLVFAGLRKSVGMKTSQETLFSVNAHMSINISVYVVEIWLNAFLTSAKITAVVICRLNLIMPKLFESYCGYEDGWLIVSIFKNETEITETWALLSCMCDILNYSDCARATRALTSFLFKAQ